MPPYYSYRSYLKKKFGKPVLKIPVNAGFSCPNRDGTKSDTGCTFCDNRSFSPVALNNNSTVTQLENSIRYYGTKYELFIPYLQPFSNTYGTVDQLRSIYEPLIALPGVCGLAIGTRPDCFSDDLYAYLEELAQRTYLSIELGLQSANDETLRLCNRGHTVSDFVEVVERLSDVNIETVAHCMLGLPGDKKSDIIATADFCASLTLTGVKIHQLMIIKGTVLETLYNKGQIELFTLEQYASILGEFIQHLGSHQHIHRLMADSKQEHGLIAPLWSAHKAESMRYIADYIVKNKIIQGANNQTKA